MYKIIYEKTFNYDKKSDFISPKIPPNNIKLIREIFGLTDKELSQKLDIDPRFLSSVLNNKAIFSGGLTLKLMKEFDLSFSSIYDIRSKITTQCEDFKLVTMIIAIDKTNSENKYQIINCVVKDNNDSNTFSYVNVFNLGLKDNLLDLNIQFDRYMNDDIKDILLDSIINVNEQVNNLCDKYNYMLISYLKKSFIEKTILIDTGKSLDIETDNILFSLPFKKLINVSVPEEDYTIKLDHVKLNRNYNIIRDNKIYNTDILNKDEYKIMNDKKTIVFTALSSDNTLNKLQLYRWIKGYDIPYMANALNLSIESYKLLESGHNRISTHQMWKLENHFGIQIENIINIDKYIEKFINKL